MVGVCARKGAVSAILSGFIACAVGLGPLVHSSAADPVQNIQRSFVIDCGPEKAGPELRLTREVRPAGGRADVTLTVVNTGTVPAKSARFAEDLSKATDDIALDGARATAGRLTYDKPQLHWTGDLAPGGDATIHYAFGARPGPSSIRTVDTDAGTTCQSTVAGPRAAATTKTSGERPPPSTGSKEDDGAAAAQRRASAAASGSDGGHRSSRSAKAARRAALPFGQRYANNFRGAITRAGNTLLTCYPPAVADCATRRNGTGNNNVAAQYVDVDRDSSTFNSSTAGLTLTPGAQVAYARLYWGGRSQTTTDTPGLPAGNRFSPNISQRGQILLKMPGGSYQTITAAPGDIGDTPDNVTTGIVYGASADVTSLVAAGGAGTYTAANLQAAQGFDSLGAFGGWSLVVAYRDPALPLRNISVFDGFLVQENGAPDTTIDLSGFRTPVTGPVNVQLGQIAYDGDNAIVGDSLTVKTTNGPSTVLSDALHPANNFFNSTIATLGSQVTDRNPTYTNTLGYDSNILNASSAFRNNDTSARFTFSTVGDAYWPHAFFTQIDLHQANMRLTKTAQVVGGGTPVPGSVIQYTVTAANAGDDNAINVVLNDPIPANTTYVPGTIVITSGPNAGPKTDQPGDDQGEFVGNSVNLQLGTGATAFTGGTLAPGQSTSATFQVTLDQSAAGTTVTNSSTVHYSSADTPTEPGETTATSTVIVPPQISSLALLKTAEPPTVVASGRVITYSYLVTNTGDTTLTNVSAHDIAFSGSGPPPVVTCPLTTLVPQQSMTCTGTYTSTQADVDTGSIVDTATATGTPPIGRPVTSNESTATVTATPVSGLALLKTASPSIVSAAGQTVTYSYEITNTGSTTLTNVHAQDIAFSGTGTPPVITCPVTTLAPQETTTCTGTYAVTQADVNAGSVTDTATATGNPPSGPAVTSDPSTATVTATPLPSLGLLKTASPTTVTAAGQTVTYSYAVTNTGNLTLTNLGVQDVAFSGSGTPPVVSCPVTTLAPGASTTCTGTYSITQADINAGGVTDTATATGTPPTGPAVTSNESTATVIATPSPSLALLKTASPSTVGSAGQVVTYSYEVVNTGNVTLTNVSAHDIAFSGSGTPPVVSCPVTTLAPGASTTCTGTYTVTQADVNAGSIVDTATASGTPPTGPATTSDPSTATVTITSAPRLTLLKTVSPLTVGVAGRVVTYSYEVVNTGNVTLTNVSAHDIAFSGSGTPPVISCPVTTLNPGESTICTGTYTVTQADINAGAVTDTATASGTPPTGPAVTSNESTATLTAVQAPTMALLKTASPSFVTAAGQTVTYSFDVINTGNVALTNVGVADIAFSGSGTPPVITCPLTTLNPEESTTCTGTYAVTQADIDAGGVTDTARASGTPPTGPAISSNDSTATVTTTPGPALSLLKTVSQTTVVDAGRMLTYSYEVVNTGNLTLTNVHAQDIVFTGSGTPPVITCPLTTLNPGESTTCTGTYTTTQADIDAGGFTDTATAAGTPPTGPDVTSNESTVTVTATHAPGLSLLKTASPSAVGSAGQVVTYSYEVDNIGNLTVTNLGVQDVAFSGSGTPPVVSCPVSTLAPGGTTTCTATYTVTQADINAGGVTDTATATGTPPTGPAVTSNESTATVIATPSSSLALLKAASPSEVSAAGQTVTYSYEVVNTGNLTLTNVHAQDVAFSGSGTPPVISCPVTTLAPGATTTCTGTYTVTQADIDAGSIVDTATATGTPPTGPAVTSNESTATVTATSTPSLALLKTANPTTVTAAGQTVTYSFKVTNTGNTTLTGLTVADSLFTGRNGPIVITCPVTTLLPQQTTTCTGTYTVTQADIDAGSIVDTATATGTPPTGPPVTSNPSTATVTATPAPSLALLKTAFPSSLTAAGRLITYSYAVTNTGNTTLTNVHAQDVAFSGSGTPPVVTCPLTTLLPQQTMTCTGTYTSTQADVDAGSIVDTATATGTPPAGPAVTSDPSTATVTIAPAPSLALLKTAAPSTVTQAGQTVTYSFAVINTGNTTLTNLTVTDGLFTGRGDPPPVITCPVTTLLPQQTTTCTATYTVTQADIDAGSIVDTAVARGTPPSGPVVTSNPSTATVTASSIPGLALVKTANPTSVSAAGQVVTYSYQVTNVGNTTLRNVSAQDTAFSGSGPPPAVTCPVTMLVPQQTTTCTGIYPVTQADIDGGAITDTATASGTPPTGPAVTSNPSTATVIAEQVGQLSLLKTASPASVTAAGQTVTYSYEVVNTGNTTLTGVSAHDIAFSGSGVPPVVTCPVSVLAPGAATMCTGTYAVTQADMDAGSVVDTAIASGTPPSGPAVTSNESTATVAAEQVGQLALLKTASPASVTAAGQTVSYSYEVVNTGNVTLTGVSAHDIAFSGSGVPPVVTCPVSVLAPGAATTCTGSYAVTQADVDAGSVVDTATASGTPPSGPAVTSNESTATVTAAAAARLALLKTASPPVVGGAGRVVTYSYDVTNTGNTTLTNVSAQDIAFSGAGTPPVITCPVTTLVPGASTRCTGTYTVTQADVDAGSIVDTATATGTPPAGPAVTSNPSTATVTAEQVGQLSLLKTASPASVTAAGQTVTYSYEVVNTGNVTLTSISVQDIAFSGAGTPPVITCPDTPVAPEASTTCTGTYTVTQADMDAGSVVDTATATGTPLSGPAVTSNESTATVTANPAPRLALVKTADPATVMVAGEVVTYSYRVTNVGNTTLRNVTAADTSFSGSGAPPVIRCSVTTLAPQQTTTCTGTYATTQADVDAGSIVDTATASGTPPSGPAVTSNESTATVAAEQVAQLALLKTADPSAVTAAGQTVTYSYEVVNTGNTTLTGVSARDIAFSGSGVPPVVTCPVSTLAPAAATRCTGTYTVTQADIDAGGFTDTAAASGTPPAGPAVTSNESTATVTTTPGPSLELLKTAAPPVVGGAGRVITYSYLVVNTGNVTLTSVSAHDIAFSGSGTPPVVTCPDTTLAPGAFTTCTGTYTVTQADVDAGSIVDTATATGTPPSGPAVTSNPSTATVTATPTPSLALLKTASPSTTHAAGGVITYSYEVVNTGNTTLTNVSAHDTAFSGSGVPPVVTCPVSVLAPGAATMCTGTYTVTQADMDAGSIVDTAIASGTPPSGPAVTSNESTATVAAEQVAQLALLKTADPSAVTAAGQTVTYSYEVVNTGNVTLTGVSAHDIAFSGSGVPPVVTCPVSALAPAATTRCTGTYTVTQADIDAGGFTDTATASGTPPSGPAVTSNESTATVTTTPGPSLELLKTAAPPVVDGPGQVITYSYLVVNTGNTTLTSVTAQDIAFSGTGTPPVITCPVTTLAPGASTTCTGRYVTTQADIDVGSIVDTAIATGTPPGGPPVVSNESTAIVFDPQETGLTLLKTADPTTVTSPGQTITYSYRVTNTGGPTLTNLSVTDTEFSGTGRPPVITCPVTTLPPRESTTCTGTYVVTAADIAAGSITDSAVASATTPGGTVVTSDPSSATVTALPRWAVVVHDVKPGAVVVSNNGNNTLTDLDVVQGGTAGSATYTCPVSMLAPGDSTTCAVADGQQVRGGHRARHRRHHRHFSGRHGFHRRSQRHGHQRWR